MVEMRWSEGRLNRGLTASTGKSGVDNVVGVVVCLKVTHHERDDETTADLGSPEGKEAAAVGSWWIFPDSCLSWDMRTIMNC